MTTMIEVAELNLRTCEQYLKSARRREAAAQDIGQEKAAQADRQYWERQTAAARDFLDQLRRPADVQG